MEARSTFCTHLPSLNLSEPGITSTEMLERSEWKQLRPPLDDTRGGRSC